MCFRNTFLHFFLLALVFLGLGCEKKSGESKQRPYKTEAYLFFSNKQNKDHFVLEFLGKEVLFGNTRLRIFSPAGDTLYDFTWEVSNYFWKEDTRYLDESQRIQKFWNIFDHTLDESSFCKVSELKITGLIQSADEDIAKDIVSDSTNVALLLKVQDYCVAYSKKYNKAILVRAIRKSFLKKYNLL